jgi:SNF2 family DNA or RNA helicase
MTESHMRKYDLVVTTFEMVLHDWKTGNHAKANMEPWSPDEPPPKQFRTHYPLLLINWLCIIVDEISKASNINSQTTQSILALRNERRIGGNGTPIQNDYHNIQALITFLGIEPWNDEKLFKKASSNSQS